MSKKNTRVGTGAAAVIALLAFSAFVGAGALMMKGSSNFVTVSFANDEENSVESSDESDSEDSNDAQEKAKESLKKQAEREREATKKQLERTREINKQQLERSGKKVELQGSMNNEDDEDGIESDDDSDDVSEGKKTDGFKSRTEILSKLQEKLAEAEKHILEKQSEGVDVTIALARLADAKAKVAAVGSAFDANDINSAKQFNEEARKLAHFALNEDVLDPEKISEHTEKVDKRLNQVKEKLAKLKALGGDTSSFESLLASVQILITKAKAELAAGDPNGVADMATAQSQLKSIKDSLRSALFALGGKDDEFGDDHESEVDEVADNLDEVADIEDDSVGPRIRVLANAQRSSAKKMNALVEDAQSRGKLAEFLIGAKQETLSKIADEIKNNEAQVVKLESTVGQIDDPEVKQILGEQISALKQETIKLQSFIANQSEKSGLFGWLTRWF